MAGGYKFNPSFSLWTQLGKTQLANNFCEFLEID